MNYNNKSFNRLLLVFFQDAFYEILFMKISILEIFLDGY